MLAAGTGFGTAIQAVDGWNSPSPNPPPVGEGATVLLSRLRERRDEMVRWLEVFHHSLQLNTTPLSIAEIFEKQIGGKRARVDIHFRDAGGEAGFFPLPERDGIAQSEDRLLGQPVQLSRAGVAVCSAEHAGAEHRWLYRCGGAGRAAADRGEQGARLPAVHQPARDAARPRNPAGRIRPQAAGTIR